jgi:hypothetical protein
VHKKGFPQQPQVFESLPEKFASVLVTRVYLVNHHIDFPAKWRHTSEETYSVLFVDAYSRDRAHDLSDLTTRKICSWLLPSSCIAFMTEGT